MRNEKILQLIAYYFSIDGNIIYLNSKLTSMNSIIDDLFNNYVLSNIFMILYDKNLTPSQMIDNFMNFDSEKYTDEIIEEKEDEIYRLKKYIETLTKQKEIIHNEFIKFCKDKFEIKKKYFSIMNKQPYNASEIGINNNNDNPEENNNSNGIENDNENENDIDIDDNNNINNTKKGKDVDSLNDENIIDDIINKNNKNNSNHYGIQTRTKKEIIYFDGKHKKVKNIKKIIRKKKSNIVGKTGKYFIDNK